MQLSDKVVLVTGGAGGLGRGICLVMAQRGAEVAVVDVDPQGAESTAGELARGGHNAKAYQGDVTARGELDALVREAIGEFGRIDALVNAAGVIGAPGFEESTRSREEDWAPTRYDPLKSATGLPGLKVGSVLMGTAIIVTSGPALFRWWK